ncbi:MAG: 16S rRNA (adenine(1518)-N(6)/adenine(1519)-N(6))-dimethyltransferase RsmA [Bacteroidota bacterium]
MKNFVKPKKYFGQHFLKDEDIACKITESLSLHHCYKKVLEIGPGMGVLTKYLVKSPNYETFLIEIDNEAYEFLQENFGELGQRILHYDFLKFDIAGFFSEPIAIIGNFPYNISSQILFRVFDNRIRVFEVVGMFQKEVAKRIAAGPNSKDYGILSVLMQAFYDIEYLFTVEEDVFYPPPKVKSAVIRLKRNDVEKLDCDEKLFTVVVKTAFNQRRKTLRNALSSVNIAKELLNAELFSKRAEQLTVAQFVEITNMVRI